MAKYQIKHACGHWETVELFGKRADREWNIERLEGRLCDECYNAQRKEKADARNAELALPGLLGSEKQVAWANDLREKLVTQMTNLRKLNADADEDPQDPDRKTNFLKLLDGIIETARTERSAVFFIEMRNARELDWQAYLAATPEARATWITNMQKAKHPY